MSIICRPIFLLGAVDAALLEQVFAPVAAEPCHPRSPCLSLPYKSRIFLLDAEEDTRIADNFEEIGGTAAERGFEFRPADGFTDLERVPAFAATIQIAGGEQALLKAAPHLPEGAALCCLLGPEPRGELRIAHLAHAFGHHLGYVVAGAGETGHGHFDAAAFETALDLMALWAPVRA